MTEVACSVCGQTMTFKEKCWMGDVYECPSGKCCDKVDMVDDLDGALNDVRKLAERQRPLGQEFEQALSDNIEDLYDS